MVRYSEELIEDIKNSNDIVDIISQYVILKRSGRNFFGLCPFHKEKTSSFSVSPDKQIFHCFGCGAHGDVIRFLRAREIVHYQRFGEALRHTLDDLDSKNYYAYNPGFSRDLMRTPKKK